MGTDFASSNTTLTLCWIRRRRAEVFSIDLMSILKEFKFDFFTSGPINALSSVYLNQIKAMDSNLSYDFELTYPQICRRHPFLRSSCLT